MAINRTDIPLRVDFYIKQGTDLNDAIGWYPGGLPMDFTGCQAMLKVGPQYGGPTYVLISTTASPSGILTFSLGQVSINITKAAPVAVLAPNAVIELYIVDAAGSTWCLASGYLRVEKSLQ